MCIIDIMVQYMFCTGKSTGEQQRRCFLFYSAHMSIMRWKLYEQLKAVYGGGLHLTYGSTTAYRRSRAGLEKTHAIDARCISGHPDAAPAREAFYMRKVRRHNRQIHKATIDKGGIRKRNQAPYVVKGFRLFDKVRYKGEECFIFGRRNSGYFDLRKLDGTKVHASASYKTLQIIEPASGCIIERRMA